jgi:hypothetical protein
MYPAPPVTSTARGESPAGGELVILAMDATTAMLILLVVVSTARREIKAAIAKSRSD